MLSVAFETPPPDVPPWGASLTDVAAAHVARLRAPGALEEIELPVLPEVAQRVFLAYAARSPITSLQQAVSRLGTRTLREIAIVVACKARAFQVKGHEPLVRAIFEHSLTTALFAREVARLRRGERGDPRPSRLARARAPRERRGPVAWAGELPLAARGPRANRPGRATHRPRRPHRHRYGLSPSRPHRHLGGPRARPRQRLDPLFDLSPAIPRGPGSGGHRQRVRLDLREPRRRGHDGRHRLSATGAPRPLT